MLKLYKLRLSVLKTIYEETKEAITRKMTTLDKIYSNLNLSKEEFAFILYYWEDEELIKLLKPLPYFLEQGDLFIPIELTQKGVRYTEALLPKLKKIEDKTKILETIRQNNQPIWDSELSEKLGINLYKVRVYLNELENSNLIKQCKESTLNAPEEQHCAMQITPEGHLAIEDEIPIENINELISINPKININNTYNPKWNFQNGTFGIGCNNGEIKE